MLIRASEQGQVAVIPLDHASVLQPVPESKCYEAVRDRIDRDRVACETFVGGVAALMEHPKLEQIPQERGDPRGPFWNNPYFSGADARLAYAIAAYYAPRVILEVGAGNSSRFFRRAIQDFDLPTRMFAIDPVPRDALQGICDQHWPVRLQDAPLSLFDELQSGRAVFGRQPPSIEWGGYRFLLF